MKSLTHLQDMVDLESLYGADRVTDVLAVYKQELEKVCGSDAIVLFIGKHGGDHKIIHSDTAAHSLNAIVKFPALSEIEGKQLPVVCQRESYGTVEFVGLKKLSVGVLDLTRHFGVALFRALQQEERSLRFRQSALRLAMVRQTAGVINGLDLESVLAKLMELCRWTVAADAGCIALKAGEESGLEAQTDLGFGDEHLQKLQLKSGEMLAEVVAKDKCICLVKPGEDFAEFQQAPVFEHITSLLAVPLHTRYESPGCVVLINPKEVEPDQIKLLSTVIDLCSSAIDNAILHRSMVEKEVLRGQLEIAGAIQHNLLPDASPVLEGASFAGKSVPCDDSGGDFYDYLRSENGDITFVLGDATGHGIGAALVATTVRALMRAKLGLQPESGLDLAKILSEINDLAEIDLPDDRFMTLIVGQYECSTRTLSWASAGHDPAGMVFRAQRGSYEMLESTGLPLGMFSNSDYVQGASMQLQPGDLLLLMTDGITEAENGEGQQYGDQRVSETISNSQNRDADGLLNELVDNVFEYVGSGAQRDDITLLCLMIDGEEEAA